MDHEKLDVYKVSIQFTAWNYALCAPLEKMDRHARDQLVRASQSIPLNIAEGNGKRPSLDRTRFYRIALGSALESAAALDILYCCDVITQDQVRHGKSLLIRVVAMLTKMTGP